MSAEVAEAICEQCEGRGWILQEDGGPGTAEPCTCQIQSVAPRLLDSASIPERYRGCSFRSFNTDDPDEGRSQQLLGAKTRAERYVDEFLTDEGRFTEFGLLFSGPTGVGKTHLAVAVLSALTHRYRVHGLFADCTALMHRLQATFEPGSERGKRDVLEPVLGTELLLLDDLGAQKGSRWTDEILYLVLNERYSARRPTLVTTNLRLEPDAARPAAAAPGRDYERGIASDHSETPRLRRASVHERLPASLVSRLSQMTRSIRIEAGDFRQEIKSHQ